jgi:glycosyltransferase involved in cell wall biosynthesis
MTACVLDVELSQALPAGDQALPYAEADVLLRWHGRPVGRVRVPLAAGRLRMAEIQSAIEADHALTVRLAEARLAGWLLANVPATPPPALRWSVVICTRDRTEDLARCLEALLQINLSGGEIIVVDNAPSDDCTARLSAGYPVRYVREDRPGLNWARMRGAQAASGEVVLYSDDDVVVDPGWVVALLAPFAHPRVGAVTGLTVPLELETAAQELFEQYGGFGRGYRRRVFDYTIMAPAAAGIVGAGANMAFRRSLLLELGLFEAELDCGTVTRTGGDAYAFYKLLAEGFQIVYEPAALVRHRHRRDYASLRRTLAGYSVGGFAFLTRCWHQHGDWQALAVAAEWFWTDHCRQLARALLRRPLALPLDLVLAQIAAIPLGPWAYLASLLRERGRQRALAPAAPSIAGGELT